MKKPIESNLVPKAIGPYNQAVECGNMLFVSGQLPVHVDTGMPGTIKEQTRQALKNIGHILDQVGMDYNHVVKTTCYLSSMDDFKEMNEVYGEFFPDVAPARATFAVKELPLKALVEIECIAMKMN